MEGGPVRWLVFVLVEDFAPCGFHDLKFGVDVGNEGLVDFIPYGRRRWWAVLTHSLEKLTFSRDGGIVDPFGDVVVAFPSFVVCLLPGSAPDLFTQVFEQLVVGGDSGGFVVVDVILSIEIKRLDESVLLFLVVISGFVFVFVVFYEGSPVVY